MILEGTIVKLIGMQEGISKTSGKEWKLAQYLVDTTTNPQYSTQVAVDVFGADRIEEFAFLEGEGVKLEVDIESSEFNGRWYTSVRAYKKHDVGENEEVSTPAAPVTPAAPATQVTLDSEDKLPF